MKRIFVSTLAILVVFTFYIPDVECGLLDSLPDVLVRLFLNWNRKWAEFKCKYDKHYPCVRKELEAYTNYMARSANVDACNRRYALNQTSFSCGINENSDISYGEWLTATTYNRSSFENPSNNNTSGCGRHGRRSKRAAPPASVDWRGKATTSAKQQGTCGSCYSFSTAAYIEGQLMIAKKSYADYSSQQIVDCSQSYGNHGCDGGLEGNVFRYLQRSGCMLADDYRYTGRVGTCKNNGLGRASVTKVYNERSVSIEYLKHLVAARGPVCVGMYASDELLQDYKTGVYSCRWCPTHYSDLDHAVLLVGYGSENGKDYWLIKNSWGDSFGIGGYFKIDMASNNCGIVSDITYADVVFA